MKIKGAFRFGAAAAAACQATVITAAPAGSSRPKGVIRPSSAPTEYPRPQIPEETKEETQQLHHQQQQQIVTHTKNKDSINQLNLESRDVASSEVSHPNAPPPTEDVAAVAVTQTKPIRRYGYRFDEIDRKLFRVCVPLSVTLAIGPLVAATDLFWVNRLGDALAVAAHSAGSQIYNSAFMLFSFIPAVTATLVSKHASKGEEGIEGVQDAVCQALALGSFISIAGTAFIFFKTDKALSSIFKSGAPALAYAKPYLKVRSFGFGPMIACFVGFSSLRGTLDVTTPIKVSILAFSIIFVGAPSLIHAFGLGLQGSAIASLASEATTAFIYLATLRQRRMIRWSKLTKIPAWSSLKPLLKGGLALQLRSLALNISMIISSRKIQALDDTGVTAAAHAMTMQTFQLGGIVLSAVSLAAQTIIPNAMVERYDEVQKKMVGGTQYAQVVARRLLGWGCFSGCVVGILQIILLPMILKTQPLLEVRTAARTPSLIASWFQGLNGLVMVGEAIMLGSSKFWQLSFNTGAGALAYFISLQYLPQRYGLVGVWMGLASFMLVRLAGVCIQLYIQPIGQRETPADKVSKS